MFGWMTPASTNAPAKVCERLIREMSKQPRAEQERVLDALVYEMRLLASQAGEEPATRHMILVRLNHAAEQRRAVMREGHTSESDPHFAKAALVEAYYEALLRDKPAIERIVIASRDWAARLGMQAEGATSAPIASPAPPHESGELQAGERKTLRRAFDQALALVQRSEAEQLAAAYAVHVVRTHFIELFATVATFRGAGWCDRDAYLSALAETAKALNRKIGAGEGRGAYLYSIYLWAVHMGDADLEQHARGCLEALERRIPR